MTSSMIRREDILSNDFLERDENLTPEEQLVVDLDKLETGFALSRSAKNLLFWYVGDLYEKLNGSDNTYGDATMTAQEIADTLGISIGTVSNSRKIRLNYSLEEIKEICMLTNRVIRLATDLPDVRRMPVLREYKEGRENGEYADDSFILESMTQMIEDANTLPDASGQEIVEVEEAETETVVTTTRLTNRLESVQETLAEFKHACETSEVIPDSEEKQMIRNLFTALSVITSEISDLLGFDE